MKAKLTYVHLGLGETEIGVQFEATDDAGATATQRAYLPIDDVLTPVLAPVWLAAQQALAAKLGQLPVTMPPGEVTSALMKMREAEAAVRRAEHEKRQLDAAHAQRSAQIAALDTAHAQRTAQISALDAAQSERATQLAALDAEHLASAVRLAQLKSAIAEHEAALAAKQAEATAPAS